jgi:hypothetical protein
LLQALSKNKLTAAAAVRVLVVRMVLSLKSMPGNVPLASRFRLSRQHWHRVRTRYARGIETGT